MLKTILLLASVMLAISANSQGDMQRIVVPTSSGQDSALLHLPNDFNTTFGTYPLLVFCQGDGESGNNLSKIYTSTTSGGPAYVISQNKFPSSFLNPKDQKQYKFVFCAPQQSSWSIPAKDLDVAIQFLVVKYRIDPSRIYVTGLSAGSESCEQYAGHYQFIPKYKEAAGVTLSTATDQSLFPSIATAIKSDGAHWLSFGDTKDDVHGSASQLLIQDIGPTLGTFVDYICASNSGHGCWNTYYDPNFLLNGMNIYQWLLQFTATGNVTPPPIVIPPVTIPPVTGPRKPQTFIMQPGVLPNVAPAGDVGIKMPQGSLIAGDTVVIPSNIAWTYGEVNAYGGTAANKIVVINSIGAATFTGGLTIRGRNVKWTGSGVPGIKYGFISTNPTPNLRSQRPFGFTITDSSSNVEVERVFIHNTGEGFNVKNENDCNMGLQYPAWTIGNISLHDNAAIGCWDEGFYIGNTSPDNGATSYDPRPVTCNGVVTYPRPLRVGPIFVYNNYIDSCGRGGIQLASASGGWSRIYNNTIFRCGMNGDDQQGTGISTGAYTKVLIDSNNVSNTYTWNVAVLGGDSVIIRDNKFDSAGMLRHYNLASTSKETTDPRTEQLFNDSLLWVQNAFAKTVRNDGGDSTVILMTGNTLGLSKNVNKIDLLDGFGLWKKNASVFCNNFIKGTTTLAPIFLETPAITYSTCVTSVPPIIIPPVVTPPAKNVLFSISLMDGKKFTMYSDGTYLLQ